MHVWRRVIPILLSAACQGTTAPPAPALSSVRSPGAATGPAIIAKETSRPSAGAIAGTVIDAAGAPVHGARVALVPMGLFDPTGARFVRVDSNADGSFRLAGAGAGRYGVTATALGGTAAWVADLEAGQTGLRLQLGRGGRRLSGHVRDRGGRPRAGAEVRLARGLGEQGDIFLVESASEGRWSAVVPDGDYHAYAVHAGNAAAQQALPAGRDSVDLVVEPARAPGPPPPAVVQWIRANQLPLTTVEPARGLSDLSPLRAVVGDARVVGLGEATHGTREIFQLKHRLFEFLVSEMGFTVLAIEIGLPESFAIDEYVLGGPGDPEQLLAGQRVAVWQTEELRDVLRWMREWNRTHARKVRFHGLDMRTGIRAAREVLAYLARVDRAALKSPAVRALAPMADPIAYQEVVRSPRPELAALAARAAELAARFDARRAQYVARSSPESWWQSAMQARVSVQLIEWLAAADTAARVRVRESAMAENVIRALEHRGPEARAVVWAHNAHIAGNMAAEPQMMGVRLRARLGASYRSFGSVLARGSYQSVDGSSRLLRDFTVAPARAGSIEHALATAGQPISILDLRALPATGIVARWFHAFQAMRQFDGLYDDVRPEGWADPSAIIAREYDALFFVAAGTVARRLPLARAVHAERQPPATSLANLDLEEADGTRPRGWPASPAHGAICGYAVELDRERPYTGRASARIARTREPRPGACAGQLRQLVEAAAYRGKRVRLRAAARVERAGEHAHLQLEAGGRRAAALASGRGWRTYDVVLDVPSDAPTLELGLAFDGEGRAGSTPCLSRRCPLVPRCSYEPTARHFRDAQLLAVILPASASSGEYTFNHSPHP